MKLCSGHNHTVTWASILPPTNSLYFYEENGRLQGQFTKYYLESVFLEKVENTYDNCKFAFSNKIGSWVKENNSYDGNIGLLVENKADVTLRAFNYYINDFSVEFSSTLTALQYFVLQTIPKDIERSTSKQVSFDQFIDNILPSFGFLFLFLITNFVYLTALLLVIAFYRPVNLKAFIKLFASTKTKYGYIKIISLSYVIFLFLMNQFFCNNLNTKKIVIKTDYFLSTKDKVLATDKEPCFIEDSVEIEYFVSAPRGTLANQIYMKRNKLDPCMMFKDVGIGNVADREQDRIFVVVLDFGKRLLLKAIQFLCEKNTFLSKDPLFETHRVFLKNSNSKPEVKKLIDKWCNILFTYGFVKHMEANLPEYDVPFFKKPKVNFDLSEYINEHTIVGQLTYANFIHVFKIQFYLEVIAFFIFLAHHLLKFCKQF